LDVFEKLFLIGSIQIEEEVEWFLGTLDFERMPLEKITYKSKY
jgi:hypothetical protein